MFEHHISQEGFERLHAWCLEHCPEAAQDPEFLPGLIVVIELEVARALRESCWRSMRILTEPCKQ